jgi:chemotaxis protein CheD
VSRLPAGPSVTQVPDQGNRPQLYLHAGQLVATVSPTAITTVLGSCIAVCLHDPTTRIGGMNHFLLPLHVERDRSPRFGTIAVPQLVDEVLRAGASRRTLVAKVFGGASVIGGMPGGRRLGEENARLAFRLLEEARIPVLDRDVGGSRGRKVVFLADEGTAWVRQL